MLKLRHGDNQGLQLFDKFNANGRTYLVYKVK